MCIPYEHMPKNSNSNKIVEQLLKHILRVFLSLGGKFNSVGLAHSGSQPLNCFMTSIYKLACYYCTLYYVIVYDHIHLCQSIGKGGIRDFTRV